MASEVQQGVRKTREGYVVSDAMEKTFVVRVHRRMRHPVYGKELTMFRKFYAHDEKNEARKGDLVRIEETRPLSRLKRWRLVEIVRKGTGEVPGSSHDTAEN